VLVLPIISVLMYGFKNNLLKIPNRL